MTKLFYTKPEVARLLRVTPRTIERYVRRGTIQAVSAGGPALFPVAQFDKLPATTKREATPNVAA